MLPVDLDCHGNQARSDEAIRLTQIHHCMILLHNDSQHRFGLWFQGAELVKKIDANFDRATLKKSCLTSSTRTYLLNSSITPISKSRVSLFGLLDLYGKERQAAQSTCFDRPAIPNQHKIGFWFQKKRLAS